MTDQDGSPGQVWAAIAATVISALVTAVVAYVTVVSGGLFDRAKVSGATPDVTATVTRTQSAFPTITPGESGSPQATVTVTAGPEIRVVLPSSLAISVDSKGAGGGDGGSGMVTAVGGFLTGVGAVITALVAWFGARRRRAAAVEARAIEAPAKGD